MPDTDYNGIVESIKQEVGDGGGIGYVCVQVETEETKDKVVEIIEDHGGVISGVYEVEGNYYSINFT